uniref:PWWP domain containing 2A n=1 Tax=Gadus morhua TaxID=8049 RepID=A0A8C5CIT0_GADMO
MAAVAAEPAGAASVPTAATAIDDTGPLEPGPGKTIYSGDDLPTDVRREYAAVSDPAGPGGLKDGDVVEECGHVGPAAGTTAPSPPRTTDTEENTELFPNDTPTLPEGAGEPFSPGPVEYRSVMTDSQPSAVFLLSFPAHPAAPEAGLSLNPADPLIVHQDSDLSYTSLTAEDARPPDNSSSSSMPTEHTEDARVDTVPGRSPDRTSSPVGTATIMDIKAAATDHSTTSYGGFSRTQPTCCVVDGDLTPSNPPGESTPDDESKPEPLSVEQLSAGSEVRVSLDHIIDDALVVSFRLGEKVFSGVLMDLSRRFGPYGIPITVFPERSKPPPSPAPPPSQEADGDGAEALPPPPPRTSKPPPLFQDGAPYPPPLLIRDSYNQALPQPPPRKIKRPKRRYRFEDPPTSIMNAIKLRPRQLLCDKCKGLVSTGGGGAPREARRGGGGGGGGAEEASML